MHLGWVPTVLGYLIELVLGSFVPSLHESVVLRSAAGRWSTWLVFFCFIIGNQQLSLKGRRK